MGKFRPLGQETKDTNKNETWRLEEVAPMDEFLITKPLSTWMG